MGKYRSTLLRSVTVFFLNSRSGGLLSSIGGGWCLITRSRKQTRISRVFKEEDEGLWVRKIKRQMGWPLGSLHIEVFGNRVMFIPCLNWGLIKGIFIFSITKWSRRVLIWSKLNVKVNFCRSEMTSEFLQISHKSMFFFFLLLIPFKNIMYIF